MCNHVCLCKVTRHATSVPGISIRYLCTLALQVVRKMDQLQTGKTTSRIYSDGEQCQREFPVVAHRSSSAKILFQVSSVFPRTRETKSASCQSDCTKSSLFSTRFSQEQFGSFWQSQCIMNVDAVLFVAEVAVKGAIPQVDFSGPALPGIPDEEYVSFVTYL